VNYLYESEKCSYEDYASGRVLYNMPGTAPFPARLGSEIFERCNAVLNKKGIAGPYNIYDPFCGSGYLLTVLGFLHNGHIKRITASDTNSDILKMTERNLELLSILGLNERMSQIEQLISLYGKQSHKDALASALKLMSLIGSNRIEVDCFCANAAELGIYKNRLADVDMVITDLPYGKITHWSDLSTEADAAAEFLTSLYGVIPAHSVIAVVSDKKQKVKNDLYRRLEHFNVGKRQVVLLDMV
jgi:23S rRNA G2445 N2-methylase RlmL